MSIELRAEQKKIVDIFGNETEYLIPDFQRPYSWGYNECYQLYIDILNAFENNEEFFLGNIVIASSKETTDLLQLVDGQQRITTLTLWIKALYLLYKKQFNSEHGGLKKALYKEDWESGKLKRRLSSNILETKDDLLLDSILDMQFDINKADELYSKCINENKIELKKCNNRFEFNFIYFYFWSMNDFKDNLKNFIVFLLKKVMLLPMQLNANNSDEAIDKALKIFETINNRGMELADSDIFKAKLYTLALQDNKGELFIKKWIELREIVKTIDLSLDDIFRLYSHIIRGKEKIVTSEVKLRTFFTMNPYSPLKTKKYNEVLDNLYKIVYIYEYINKEIKQQSELSKWLQIIEAYSNQYPKIAVIVFLFYKQDETYVNIQSKLIEFCKNIIRYVYHKGATAKVKNGIYMIIKDIAWGLEIKQFTYDLDSDFFDYLGRLKKGFALLAYYLQNDKNISDLKFNRLITYNDSGLEKDDIDAIYDCLGNFVFLDLNKRNVSFENRVQYFDNSEIFKLQINPHLILHNPIEYIKDRDKKLRDCLIRFMRG